MLAYAICLSLAPGALILANPGTYLLCYLVLSLDTDVFLPSTWDASPPVTLSSSF